MSFPTCAIIIFIVQSWIHNERRKKLDMSMIGIITFMEINVILFAPIKPDISQASVDRLLACPPHRHTRTCQLASSTEKTLSHRCIQEISSNHREKQFDLARDKPHTGHSPTTDTLGSFA